MKVWVLGRGKVARALTAQLRESGVEVALQPARGALRFTAARDRTFVLAVPDDAIRALAERLAPQLGTRDVVLHCAGSRSEAELTACAARGAATAGMHPLVSFASPRKLPALTGASFVVAGAPRAVQRARWLCRKLGARCVPAPILGPAYHAAAALLANGSAALGFAAVEILCELGLARREAERGLSALLASVAFNVRELGVPAALTGPVARGDTATVRRHVRALRGLKGAHADAYRRTLPLIERCAAAQAQASPARAARAGGRSR